MTNLQKSLDLLFIANVAITKLYPLECPDPKFKVYLRDAETVLRFAESVLFESVPSSEILSLFKPSVKK